MCVCEGKRTERNEKRDRDEDVIGGEDLEN